VQERKGEREKVRGRGKCHLNGFPRVGFSSLGHCPKRMPNQLARCLHANKGSPQWVWEVYLVQNYDFCDHERADSPKKGDTY
jgi:hypothetical protein